MHRLTVALAGLAAIVAVPASAATELFNETFETTTRGGFGQFIPNGTVNVSTGQAYKNIGFDGNDGAKLANHFAAFGGGNARTPGTILSTTINGSATPTLYTINFDAAYIGFPGAGINDQYLLFTATSMDGSFVEANLQPIGSTDPDRTGVLGGGSNIDTLFTRYQYQFTGSGPISLEFAAGGSRGDNADVLIDNVLVRAGAVPETSTWAMMIIGVGSIGGVMRRRRGAARGVPATA